MDTFAEDVLDGSCCSLCGEYFEDPIADPVSKEHAIFVHDEPVVCWECWKELNEADKKLYTKARVKTIE